MLPIFISLIIFDNSFIIYVFIYTLAGRNYKTVGHPTGDTGLVANLNRISIHKIR